MEEIAKIFTENLNIDLIETVISNPKQEQTISKIKIRPIIIKEELQFQISEFKETKVFHKNADKEYIISKIQEWFTEYFKQVQITTKNKQINILTSKKGKITIKTKKAENNNKNINLRHNREKQYIIEEGVPLEFLIDLGVMTKEGKIINTKYDKFRQINRFLEFIEDILPNLDKEKEITIIDFGCGKSYLTFAMYYYLKELKSYNINIIGLDLKKDVIEKCTSLKLKYGFNNLNFKQGDIAQYEDVTKVDMVVTLHACDTATDYALAKAMKWGAKVIFAVPCCQHELNKQINNEYLKPILKYGIIKERISALVTDALRAELLESQGYKTQIMEFIDMEHTPKNILIRAVKTKNKPNSYKTEDYTKCKEFLNVKPKLEELI